MKGEKKVILHIVFDGILFDPTFVLFEKMSKYESIYLFGGIGGEKNYKYIKNRDKIIHVNSIEEWGKIISDQQVDIIYLHGLWLNNINAIDFIQEKVIVFWWCYGMEIYENCLKWPPLLPLKIYKPLTHKFWLNTMKGYHRLSAELSYSYPCFYIFLIKLYNLVNGKKGNKLKRMLARIDYAFTPLESELLELKKRHPYIKAKPFILRKPVDKEDIEIHYNTGGILFEHSATISNNHLDVIAALKEKKIDLKGRDIYIPLSYGSSKLANRVKQEFTFENANVYCMMEPLPYNDYKMMVSSCSHALFGMVRQSGLGNIYLCLKRGVKVFFWKDSILYKQFKDDGYYVYTIDDDLNENSIREPLTPEQAYNNYDIYYKKFDGSYGTCEQQFDRYLNIDRND